MELERTAEFDRAYRRLTPEEQHQVNVCLRLLVLDYRHPGLRAKKWRRPNIWYARVNRDIRLFYEVHDGYDRLRTVGHHDIERSL